MKKCFIIMFVIYITTNIYSNSNFEEENILLDSDIKIDISENNYYLLFSGTLKNKKTSDIFIIDFLKSQIYQLTNTGSNLHPSFSKSGKKVIYSHLRKDSNYYDIYTMDINGNDNRILVVSNFPKLYPTFTNNDDIILYQKSETFKEFEDLLSPVPDSWYDWNLYNYNLKTNKEEQITSSNLFTPNDIDFLDDENLFTVNYLKNKYSFTVLNYISKNSKELTNSNLSYDGIIHNDKLIVTGQYPDFENLFITDFTGKILEHINIELLYSPGNFTINSNHKTLYFTAYYREEQFNNKNAKLRIFKMNLNTFSYEEININDFTIINNNDSQ